MLHSFGLLLLKINSFLGNQTFKEVFLINKCTKHGNMSIVIIYDCFNLTGLGYISKSKFKQ